MKSVLAILFVAVVAVAQVGTIAPGTAIAVRTNETIDIHRTSGEVYSGTVAEDVRDSYGNVLISRGSPVELMARNVSGNEMLLDLESVTVNGQRYAVSSDVRSVGGSQRTGLGKNRRTAEYVGGGAVLGTIIGAIAGGGKGAGIGALAGAGAGVGAQVLTRGKNVRVPAESLVTFRIEQPLRMGEADTGYYRNGRHYHQYPNQNQYRNQYRSR